VYAILGEDLDDLRVGLEAEGLQAVRHHLEAAVGHDGPLQRRVGLQADDHLILLVDVARVMRRDRARDLRDVEHALLAFLDEHVGQLLPDAERPLRRTCEKALIPVIGFVIVLHEVADVDLLRPQAGVEGVLGLGCRFVLGFHDQGRHHFLRWNSFGRKRSARRRCFG
jgi:hypothetical protein